MLLAKKRKKGLIVDKLRHEAHHEDQLFVKNCNGDIYPNDKL